MRTTPLILATVLIAGTVSTACRPAAARLKPGQSGQQELVVRRGDFQRRILLTGQLDTKRSEVLSVPPLPTWQTNIKWMAEDGIAVKAGEKIAELDNTSFVSNLEQQKIAVTEARNALAEYEANSQGDREEKKFEYDRTLNELKKAQVKAAVPSDVLARRDYEDAQLAVKRADTEFRKAEELLRAANVGIGAERQNLELKLSAAIRELERSQSAINLMTIHSPMDGTILFADHPWEGRKLQQGDPVWVGFPIARIPDLSTLQVIADLWDVDDGKISAGDRALVTLDAFPAETFQGRVASIAPVAQQPDRASQRRSFRTLVQLDRTDFEKMRPGFSVRVVVLHGLRRNELLVPRAAVDWTEARPRVRTSDGQVLIASLGPCNTNECVVTGGIDEGTHLAPAQPLTDSSL
ncbi:MAG: efflux RND transporter periplasmic adaptor subunit [Acidobacteriota bacterium]